VRPFLLIEFLLGSLACTAPGLPRSGPAPAPPVVAPAAPPARETPEVQEAPAPPQTQVTQGPEDARDDEGREVPPAPDHTLRIDRGPGELPLLIARGEELTYEVRLSLGVFGETTVGTVRLLSGVEPYRSASPRPVRGTEGSDKEVGWIRSEASGVYLGYTLDHKVEVRHLPQAWPRVLERNVRRGSKNHTREIRIGSRDAEPAEDAPTVLEYRRTHHCSGCDDRAHFVESKLPWGKPRHCKKCKRLEHRTWKPTKTREIPPNTVDMLSAINLSRAFVRDEVDRAEFPLVRKDELWTIHLRRGGPETIDTPAGRFHCRRVGLSSSIPKGEEDDHDEEDFKGLFGLHGDIRIYVHDPTGIPVVIEGDAPLGPFDLKVRARLKAYRGTDPGFAPIER